MDSVIGTVQQPSITKTFVNVGGWETRVWWGLGPEGGDYDQKKN